MSITYLPPRTPGSSSKRYLKAFEVIAQRTRHRRIQVGSRIYLLEMAVAISQLNGVSAQVIDFPKTPENPDATTPGSAREQAAIPEAISRPVMVKRKQRTKDLQSKQVERKNRQAELLALMKRDKGATLADLMNRSGWRKPTVRAFVRSLGRKGMNVESAMNATGERTFRIVT